MKIDKRTVVVVGASTIIGFVGDVLTFSLAQKKLTLPKGKELIQLIALGVITGFIIDWAINKIEDSQKTVEERNLDNLVNGEREKILAGTLTGKKPVKIEWV